MEKRRFVLLDRDGTINVDKHYLKDPAQIELLPGAAEGLRRLQALGLGLVIVTNQSGIGRGYLSEERLADIHQRLEDLLNELGIKLDAIYFCPHDPSRETCRCRKPLTGMVEQAQKDHGFDPSRAFMIGDKDIDIALGHRIGAASILVRTGYGRDSEKTMTLSPDYIANDLADASLFIESRLRDTL